MKKNVVNKRAQKMLESDRLGISYDAENVIKRDIESLLSEYFYLKKRPEVIIDGDKTHVEINITAVAKSVKSFNILK